MLCAEHGLCLVDHFCIPQRDEEVRAALESIIMIYKTLDVIALLQGSLCACAGRVCGMLEVGLDKIDDLSKVQVKKALEDTKNDLYDELDTCLNSCGFCSWFNRLWTRQELLYSTRIQVEWASDRVAPCVKNPITPQRMAAQFRETLTRIRSVGASTEHSGENLVNRPQLDKEAVNNLSPYALNFYEQCLAEGDDPLLALRKLDLEHMRSTERAVSSFSEFLDVDRFDSTSKLRAFITFIKFLNSMFAVKDVSYDAETDTEKRLRDFFAQIGRLGSLQRAATQQRDYVAAIWVDCPGYILPIRLKNMSLSELLEDTLCQIDQKFRLSFAVCAPSGLFGASRRGTLWQPSQYLDHVETDTAHDVFGVLSRARNEPIKLDKNGHVSLQHLGAGGMARSRAASEYRALFQGKDVNYVTVFMKKVIQHWPGDIIERLGYSKNITKRDYAKATVDDFYTLLFSYTDTKQNLVDMQHLTRPFQTMLTASMGRSKISLAAHYNATYLFVADALGLNRSVCQRLGLHLTVGIFPSPCIGLSAIDLGKPMEVYLDDFHHDECHYSWRLKTSQSRLNHGDSASLESGSPA